MLTGLHDIADRSTTAQDIMRAVFRAPTDRAAVTAALDWRREWEERHVTQLATELKLCRMLARFPS
jgi:hypothetical protein